MVGQNVQGRHSELREDNDLEINIKAEQEIEVILQHLEYQNAILIAMVEKLGVNFERSVVASTDTKVSTDSIVQCFTNLYMALKCRSQSTRRLFIVFFTDKVIHHEYFPGTSRPAAIRPPVV
jgi:hypothetical protein